jgi:hypothetical protein
VTDAYGQVAARGEPERIAHTAQNLDPQVVAQAIAVQGMEQQGDQAAGTSPAHHQGACQLVVQGLLAGIDAGHHDPKPQQRQRQQLGQQPRGRPPNADPPPIQGRDPDPTTSLPRVACQAQASMAAKYSHSTASASV